MPNLKDNLKNQSSSIKILDAFWFTEMGNPRPIGIVVVKNMAGEKKAYIGTGMGGDEGLDARSIVGHGARLSKESLQCILARLTK